LRLIIPVLIALAFLLVKPGATEAAGCSGVSRTPDFAAGATVFNASPARVASVCLISTAGIQTFTANATVLGGCYSIEGIGGSIGRVSRLKATGCPMVYSVVFATTKPLSLPLRGSGGPGSGKVGVLVFR